VDWWESFCLGSIGAFASYVVLFFLPEVTTYLDDSVSIVRRRIVVFLVIMIVLVAVGGLVTMALEPADSKSALFMGMGWQGLVKGSSAFVAGLARPQNPA